jgi:hypothetical protein
VEGLDQSMRRILATNDPRTIGILEIFNRAAAESASVDMTRGRSKDQAWYVNPSLVEGDSDRDSERDSGLGDGHVWPLFDVRDSERNSGLGDGHVWPLFDVAVMDAAVECIESAFPSQDRPVSLALAASLVGSPGHLFPFVCGRYDGNRELCDIWQSIINPLPSGCQLAKQVAACIATSFVRAGMPLRPPFQRYNLHVARNPVPSPLAWAAQFVPELAHALLDLPLECGLDVNALDNVGDEDGPIGPAIVLMIGRAQPSPELFARLLDRTERSVVSAGTVNVERGLEQLQNSDTHVLVGSIMFCTWSIVTPHQGLANIVEFIAHAQSDGGGTDLTGGTTTFRLGSIRRDEIHRRKDPSPNDLWPDKRYRGALVLVENIHRWYLREYDSLNASEDGADDLLLILARLDFVWRRLLLALLRIRSYRRDLSPVMASLLNSSGIYARELHALVAAFVLVPLHDESHLQHSLLVPGALLPRPTARPNSSMPTELNHAGPKSWPNACLDRDINGFLPLTFH